MTLIQHLKEACARQPAASVALAAGWRAITKGESGMSFIDVKNKKGTADKNPPAGYASWLDFWEKKKGKKATQCEAMLCKGSPDVGGHVIKAGEGSKEYILPLCYDCNNKPDNEVFKAWDYDLVPVQ